MSNNWVFFERIIDEVPTLLSVDLGIAEQAPLKDKNKLLILGIEILRPKGNGLPESKEHLLLNDIEEDLQTRLEAQLNALQVGRFTGLGIKELYYYFNDLEEKNINEFIINVFSKYNKYKYESNIRTDTEWKFYYGSIYPTELEMNSITDMRVVRGLEKDGDSLSTPRTVTHFACFPNERLKDHFKEKMGSLGFIDVVENQNESEWSIDFSRHDKVDFNSINAITTELIQIAKEFDGKYHGWETRVVPENKLINKLKNIFTRKQV